MIGSYEVLARRIRQELRDVELLVARSERYIQAARRAADPDPFVDAAALNLHGFYSGLERIFQIIARDIDQWVPSSPQWHRELLNQMTLDLQPLRPAVLTRDTVQALEEYLGFRHVVRNVYTTRLDPERISQLVSRVRSTYSRVSHELLAFASHLEEVSREVD